MKRNNYGEVISLVYATLILLNLDAFSYADRSFTAVKSGTHVAGDPLYLLYFLLQ